MTVGLCEACQKPADLKCPSCKIVYYCTEEHQKQHWKIHKEECKLYYICCSQDAGKYLKAARDLDPGEVIFCEEPIVFGPMPNIITEGPFPCVGCCKSIAVESLAQKCPECNWPCCSLDCDGLKNANKHGLECQILKLGPARRVKTFYQYYRFDILIIIRTLLLQTNNKKRWDEMMCLEDYFLERGPGTAVYELLDEKVTFIEETYLRPVKEHEKETGTILLPDTTKELIHKIYGILEINSLELTLPKDTIAIYPVLNSIETTCLSNTNQVIEESGNHKLTLRAALPISTGEHITTCFTNILWGTHTRKQDLKHKFLTCSCSRCRDPTELDSFLSGLKCNNGTEKSPCGGIQLPLKPLEDKTKWLCNKCKIKLPNKEIMRFVNHLGGEVDKVLSRDHNVFELEDLLSKLLIFLHANHYHVNRVKHALVQFYSHAAGTNGVNVPNDLLTKKINMCVELIDVTKKIDPGNARLTVYYSILLLELFNGKFSIIKRAYAKGTEDKFSNDIRELNSLLDEGKRVIQYELVTEEGSKLHTKLCDTSKRFEAWLLDNHLEEMK